MKDKIEVKEMITIARMYYEQKLTQKEISERLLISRPQISRIINKATEMGYVRFEVIDPTENIDTLKEHYMNKFNLKDIYIVPTPYQDERLLKKSVSKAAADYLVNIIEANDIIGISWGKTLYEIAQNLPYRDFDNVSVVQLKGAITENISNIHTMDIAMEFSKRLGGKTFYFPVPTMVDRVDIKESLLSDHNINQVYEMGKKSNIAIYSIGYPSKDSVLANTGFLSGEQLEIMRGKGVVGDICSRFFDINGDIVDNELNSRILSIELDEIKKKEQSIAVAYGINRAPGILGALRGGYMNVLITDEKTAHKVLELDGEE